MEWHSQFTPAGTIDIWRGDTQVLRPGEHLTEDWAAGPLHPAANALLFSGPSVFTAPMPSALRAANTPRLELDPFDDSQPGHVIVASSGDHGFTAAQFPANLASVTAVGGTELAKAANARGWTEKVWHAGGGASGSGCSAYVAKPAWQHDPHCPGRTSADVAAVAWNIPIYDSSLGRAGPWLTAVGTSAAALLIAGVYGLAGNAATVQPGYEYAHTSALFDITRGNNGLVDGAAACGGDYLCVAKKGYDGPTGLGTPDGTGAF